MVVELDTRSNTGINVALLWEPNLNAVTVEVTGECGTFTLDVPAGANPYDYFHHPFYYAPDDALTTTRPYQDADAYSSDRDGGEAVAA